VVTDLLARATGEQGDDGSAISAPATTVRVRGAAYSVIAECLRIQADARPQSWPAKVLGATPLSADARRWYRAALGHIRAVRALGSLGPQWTLLHPEPGTSDADYLVIGPGAIYTVTIKNHSGQRVLVDSEQLLVNNRRTNHLRDARFEADRVSKLLSTEASESVAVNPLIAIVDPSSLAFGRRRPRDVTVIPSSDLARVGARRRSAAAVTASRSHVAAAERSGAWHSAANVIDDTLRHEARFDKLRHEVDAAARRNVAWIVVAAAAVLAVVLAVYLA
jgi:hypothetical protein